MNNSPIKKKTNEKESDIKPETPPKNDNNKCCKPSVKVNEPLDLSFSLCCGGFKGNEKVMEKVIIKKKEEEYYDGNLCLSLSLSPSPYFYYGTSSSSSNNQITEQLAVVNVNEPKWTFKKLLTTTDCKPDQGRLLINNKNWVESHIIENDEQKLETKKTEGISFNFFDWDEKRQFKSNLRTWRTNSYVVYKNWKIEVLDQRKLQEGDEIGLNWDKINKILYFRVLKRNHGEHINPNPASSKRKRVSKEEEMNK